MNTDLAWAAGFIDGEGAIRLARNGRGQVYVELAVSQSDPRPLQMLASLFGGRVRQVQHKSGKYKRPHFKWSVFGPKAVAAIAVTREYYRVKDKHADVALAFAQECMKPRGWNTRGKAIGGASLIDGLTADERDTRAGYHHQMRGLQVKGPKVG